jgi:hypothetical protein
MGSHRTSTSTLLKRRALVNATTVLRSFGGVIVQQT